MTEGIASPAGMATISEFWGILVCETIRFWSTGPGDVFCEATGGVAFCEKAAVARARKHALAPSKREKKRGNLLCCGEGKS